LFACASNKYADGDSLRQNKVRKRIVSKSSKEFKTMTFVRKQLYKRRAIVRASIQHAANMEKRSALTAQIYIAREKVALETSTGIRRQLTLREAVLTEDVFTDMDALWSSPAYTEPQVQRLREKHMKAPPIMSDFLAKALADEEVPDVHDQMPAWASQVADRRNSFENTAWLLRRGNTDEAVVFMFALQQPVTISFCHATYQDTHMPAMADDESADHAWREWDRHNFTVEWANCFMCDRFAGVRARDIMVFQDVVYQADDTFVSADHFPEPLDLFLLKCPLDTTKSTSNTSGQRSSSAAQKSSAASILLQKYKKIKFIDGSDDSASDSDRSGCSDLHIDEDRAREELIALRAARRALDAAPEPRWDDFRVVVRAKRLGLADDCHTAMAIGDDVVDWCRAKHMPFSARYSTEKFTSMYSAIMAAAWCSKMQHLFNIAHDGVGDPLRLFTQGDISSWLAPTAFGAARGEIIIRPRCRDRVVQLDNLGAS
jgi:hypothetical protein